MEKEKRQKRKETEKSTSKAASPVGPLGPAEGVQPGAGKAREAADKRQKTAVDPSEEVTAADFAVMAKVARLGAEAFNKMRTAVLVNTPENLAALVKENREMRTEIEKNADLLDRLLTAEKQAAENKKKAADLERVAEELETARNELAQARKDVKDAEAKAGEAEKKCQAAKKSNAEMAKLGYTRCLSQVLVIDPDFPVDKVHLTQKVENGKILGKDGQVVYAPPEIEEKSAEGGGNAPGGEEGTNQETPKETTGEN